MKKELLTGILLMCGLASQAQYQLKNAGFEEWESVSYSSYSGQEPLYWNSFLTGTGKYKSMAGRNQLERVSENRPGSTGNYSAKLFDRKVLGSIYAQGNMTTGCINMGSMSAADAKGNYNYTNIEDDAFNQKFTGLPDAMHVWVKYVSTNASFRAKANTILHTDGYYQDPEGNTITAKVIAKAENLEIESSQDWQELVIPFVYTEEVGTPSYALASFATNATPGKGTGRDYMLVDDLEYLYYSQLASLTYNGASVEGFDKNKYEYAVNEPYDATKLQAVADGKGATVKTSYDVATGKCVVRVEGNDIAANASNYHEYVIQFPVVTPFTNPLSVSINGATGEPQDTEIQLVKEIDDTYSFVLKNFMLGNGEEVMPIGNIRLTNLTVNGNMFTADQTIQILPGDLEGIAEEAWYGPLLPPVPVVLKATKLSETEMVADIDIDMIESIEQMIKVVFAPMVEINGTEEVPALNGLYNIKLSRPFVAGWNTVCLPFAYQTSVFGGDVKAQAFDSATNAGLNFVAVEDGVLAANTPYLINFPSATTMPVYFGVNIESTTPQSVTHGDFTFTGTYAAVTDMAGKYGVAKINGEDKITKGAAGSTLKATRAYFTTSGADVQSVSLFFDGEATGIEAVETAGEKAFDVYTISGVQVRRAAKTLDGLQKGIYIVNGKKQVVK